VTQATTATIEKVVRKVLKQEQDADEKATLRAIQRVSRLLTDQVIPKLDDPQEDEDTDADSDADSGPVRGRSFAAAATPDDGPGVPEGEDGETRPEIPEAVNQAFDELYSTLSQERATALATFFTAISQELGGDEGADDENPDDEDADDEDADNADDDAESHAGSL
jgi:hypothetical protein